MTTEENSTPGASRPEPLSLLWHSLAAPATLMTLMGLLAAILALSTFVPQIPAQAVDAPQAWLTSQPGLFGQRNGLIRALDLFDIFRAWWFHLLLALTGLALVVRLVDSAELAWLATDRGRWSGSALLHWGRRPPQLSLSTDQPADEALHSLRAFLGQRGFRWREVPALPAPNAVASHRAGALWAWPVFYGALLLSLIGLAIAGAWGWQAADWQPAPGEVRAVGHGLPYSLRLDAVEPQIGVQPCRRQSRLTWLQSDAEPGHSTVGFGQPASFGGVAVRQVGFVPAARLRGWDSAGQPLLFQTGGQGLRPANEIEVALSTAGEQSLVLVSNHNLYLGLIVEPSPAGRETVLHVAALQNGGDAWQPLGALSESSVVAVGDLQVEVALSHRPVLRLDHRPAMGLGLAGLILAILALAARWLVAPRLLWLAAGPGADASTDVHILAWPVARGSLWWPELIRCLGKVLADDA